MIESSPLLSSEYMHDHIINYSSTVRTGEGSPMKFRRILDNSRVPTSISTTETESQRHKVNEQVRQISLTESEYNSKISKMDALLLAEEINCGDSPIILDLRSAYSFSRLHISSAKLANCTSKMKCRRAIHIINEILKTSTDCNKIILYNEFGLPFSEDDPISALVQYLISRSLQCFYLTGGIKKFESISPKLCESGSSSVLCLQLPKSVSDSSDVYFVKASMILPFLYIGNEFDAMNNVFMTTTAITHVLNLSLKALFLDEMKFISKRINCNDNHVQDLLQYFDEAFKFIEDARLNKGKVLVHCQAGISRSATVVIAYLMSHSQDLDLNTAHMWVKRRRSIISPNFNFMGQLVQFENDLFNGTIKRNSVLDLDLSACSSIP